MSELEITGEQADQIGKLADRCDNLVAATRLPMPASFHVDQLRSALDQMATEIRAWYQSVTGHNPWSDEGEGP